MFKLINKNHKEGTITIELDWYNLSPIINELECRAGRALARNDLRTAAFWTDEVKELNQVKEELVDALTKPSEKTLNEIVEDALSS